MGQEVKSLPLKQLERLVNRATIRVNVGSSWGTGIFLSQDIVLTAAHVLKADDRGDGGLIEPSAIEMTWYDEDGTPYAYRVVAILEDLRTSETGIEDWPDVAMLRVAPVDRSTPEPSKLPLAPLSESRQACQLFTFGFYEPDKNGEPLSFSVSGIVGDRIRLTNERIVAGFSGAPLFDKDSNTVIGFVTHTKDPGTNAGGWGVLVSAFLKKSKLALAFVNSWKADLLSRVNTRGISIPPRHRKDPELLDLLKRANNDAVPWVSGITLPNYATITLEILNSDHFDAKDGRVKDQGFVQTRVFFWDLDGRQRFQQRGGSLAYLGYETKRVLFSEQRPKSPPRTTGRGWAYLSVKPLFRDSIQPLESSSPFAVVLAGRAVFSLQVTRRKKGQRALARCILLKSDKPDQPLA